MNLDSPSNSSDKSDKGGFLADNWLTQMESELVDVTSSIEKEILEYDEQHGHSGKSRKISNRMMKLYLAIACDDHKIKKSNAKSGNVGNTGNRANEDDDDDSQTYYTIVDSNNNSLNNINQALLKKLDANEIEQLKKLMLTRELSREFKIRRKKKFYQTSKNTNTIKTEKKKKLRSRPTVSTNDDSFDDISHVTMLEEATPDTVNGNQNTDDLMDGMIHKLEQKYAQLKMKQQEQEQQHQQRSRRRRLQRQRRQRRMRTQKSTDSNSGATSQTSWAASTDVNTIASSVSFDDIDSKTRELKARMIGLKKKYEYLRQKRQKQNQNGKQQTRTKKEKSDIQQANADETQQKE